MSKIDYAQTVLDLQEKLSSSSLSAILTGFEKSKALLCYDFMYILYLWESEKKTNS